MIISLILVALNLLLREYPWWPLSPPLCLLTACLCIGHHGHHGHRGHHGHYWRAATHRSPDHQLPATAPTFRWPPHRALSRAVKLVKGNHSLLLARNPALKSRQWRLCCWGPLELWIQWKMYICWKDVIPSDTRDCTGIAKYCLRCQWWRR